MDPRSIVWTVIGILLFAALGYGGMKWLASKKEEQEKKPLTEIRPFVKVKPATYTDFTSSITLFGRIASAQAVDLMVEVQGKIIAGNVPLKKGQRFGKGQLLFKIDDSEARLTLSAQKSAFMKSLAEILPDFKIDFKERYTIWEDYFNSIDIDKSLPELPKVTDNREKTFLAANSILTNFYNIKSLEERLNKYKVHAPYTGSFSEVFQEVGSIAGMNGKIARIIRTDKLEMEAPVQVEKLKWIKKGQVVEVFSENGKMNWQGKVVRIGDLVDASTQSVMAFIALGQNPESPLYEGLYLKAIIPVEVNEKVMEVPRNAVFEEDNIFVVMDSMICKQRINIHKVNPESMLISGVDSGNVVVTEFPLNAIESMHVRYDLK